MIRFLLSHSNYYLFHTAEDFQAVFYYLFHFFTFTTFVEQSVSSHSLKIAMLPTSCDLKNCLRQKTEVRTVGLVST